MHKKQEWIERAKRENRGVIVILFDQDEKEYYPVFFDSLDECNLRIKGLIISIKNQKLIEIIEMKNEKI